MIVFCIDDNYRDQRRPRRAGLALQRPEALRPFLTGAASEDVLITAADARAVVPSGADVLCPRGCARLDVGLTLAALIDDGRLAAYAPALDFMRLDVPQTQTYLARSFPTHKVVGRPVPAGDVDPTAGLRMRLTVDGQVRQDASSASMIIAPAQLVATIGRHYALRTGDLVLTGSPTGRPADTDGPWIAPGSVVEGQIAGVGAVCASVVAE